MPVQEFLEFLEGHAAVALQGDQHPGIDGAAAGSHGEPVESRVSHGRGDAVAVLHGAQAAAVAEVEDQQPRGRSAARAFRGNPGHMLEVEAMEAEAAVPRGVQVPGNGVAARHLRHRGVKGGIEAGDLRQAGRRGPQRVDRIEAEPVVQRRKRTQRIELAQAVRRNARGSGVSSAAVNDAMAAGGEMFGQNPPFAQRRQDPVERRGMPGFGRQFDRGARSLAVDGESRLRADPFGLAVPGGLKSLEDGELER